MNYDCSIILVEYHLLLVTTCMKMIYILKYGKVTMYKILCSMICVEHVVRPRTYYVSLRYLI